MRACRFLARTPIDAPAGQLFDWHVRPAAFLRLVPPWDRVRVIERDGPLAERSRVTLALAAGPLSVTWVARHLDVQPGRGFLDIQERGPFARWEHAHRFLDAGPGCSILEDDIEYVLPGGAVGRLAMDAFVRRRLRRLFLRRHAVTAADSERHRPYASRPRLAVAISGASGLVGTALAAFLEAGGHRVLRLVRGTPRPGGATIRWDPAAGLIERGALEGLDAVVHLAGAGIANGRFGAAHKARIRDSRIDSTRLLAETLAGLTRPPRVLVSASAVGYYGDRGAEILDERSPPGVGFLPETCKAWEAAAEPARRAGIRVVSPRLGVVLAGSGGALAQMLVPLRLGLGGRIGDGRQYVSWIALDDVVGLVHHALFDDDLQGPINAVAPEVATQAELTRALGLVLTRPTLLPVPAAAVRLALGEMGQALLLASARAVPARLARAGFRFRLGNLEDALRFELGRIVEGSTLTRLEWGGRSV